MIEEKTIEIYKSIAVWPEMTKLGNKKHNFRADAPLGESDNGKVFYPTLRDKQRWLEEIER